MKRKLITLIYSASLIGCGGGGESGQTAPAADQPARVTASSLHACPAERMSPVDFSKLACLVGQMDGTTSNDPASPGAPCSATIDASGTVIVRSGALTHTHALSGRAGTYFPWIGMAGFSEYTGRRSEAPGFERFVFGTNTGSRREDGSEVGPNEWSDLQLQYVGAADGSSNDANLLFIGSANGLGIGRTIVGWYVRP